MGIGSGYKGFQTVGRDGVLVKEEHKFQWSGTNGITTSLSFTNGNFGSSGYATDFWAASDGSEAAICTNLGEIYYTTNGTSWTSKNSPVSTHIRGICYWASKGLWLVVEGNNVWSAPTNFSTWTNRGTASESLQGVSAGIITDSGTDTDTAIVVGNNGMTGNSTNGTSWTFVDISTSSSRDFYKCEVALGYATASSTRYQTGLYKATNPNLTGTDPSGWKSVDKGSSGTSVTLACHSGGGNVIAREINGYIFMAGAQSQKHVAYTNSSGDILDPWNVIYDNDSWIPEKVMDFAYGNNQYFMAGYYPNGAWDYSAGCGSGVFITNSNQGESFIEYSTDLTNWTKVDLGTSDINSAHRVRFVNGNFIILGNSTSTYDYKYTPGVSGDTVSVTFDSFYMPNGGTIDYAATAGSSDPVQQDLDLFNALQQAITDGDLAGVTVTNLGSGNGVQVINQVQGSYVNPTISGNTATCTITTTVDN